MYLYLSKECANLPLPCILLESAIYTKRYSTSNCK